MPAKTDTQILESFQDAIISFSLEGKILAVNKRAEEVLKESRSKLVGKTLDSNQFNKGLEPLISGISLKGTPSPKDIELPKQKKSYQVIVNPVMKGGKKTGYTVVLRDITKEKELEQKKIDFVSLAAHELRTPITAIRGYLSVFLDEAKNLTPEQWKFIERAYSSSVRLDALVNNLLNTAHIERGIARLNLSVVNLEEIVYSIINDHNARIKEKGIKVELKKPPEPLPELQADPERMREVFTNLISNAVLYNKPNGRITISLEKLNDSIQVSVSDTGIGIPKAAQKHLFKKFFRVGEALEEESKGTGLGLYISKAVVEMHGGRIWVESELGKGTTFYFTIPIK